MPTPSGPFPQPQLEFAKQLRALRLRAGQPTEGRLATQMGCGRTTVSDILNGRRFPSWNYCLRWCGPAGSLLTTGGGSGETYWRIDEIRRSRRMTTEAAAHALLPVTWYRTNPEFYGGGNTRSSQGATGDPG